MEADYRNDYIVTWEDSTMPKPVKKGFKKQDLLCYDKENSLEAIKIMFELYNKRAAPIDKREILEIEEITRKTIFKKED